MDMTNASCREFVKALASSQPAPGGGGAAALVGALGAALGNMVASLTSGKKTYAGVQQRIEQLQQRCTGLQNALLDQVQADEAGFLPLAQAYRIPKEEPSRQEKLDAASVIACEAPLEIMELCMQVLQVLEELAQIGSRLALSDAGCGALCCKAALQSAALNVSINTKTMQDRAAAARLDDRMQALLDAGCPLADRIYETVLQQMK